MTKFMHFQGPTFTMLVPTNWFITSSLDYQAGFIAPGDDPVKPNLVVSIRRVTDNVTVRAVAAPAKAQQAAEYPAYEIIEEKDWSKDSYQALERQYQWRNQEVDATIVQRQVFILVTDVLYLLTTTRAADDEAKKLDQIFVTMLNSFKVTESPN